MTIDELIASIEVEKEAAVKRRNKAKIEIQAILGVAQQEGRSNLTEEEDQRVASLFEAQDEAKRDIEGIETKLLNAQRVQQEEKQEEKAAKEVTRTETRKPSYNQVARVGNEERVYHKGNDPYGTKFLRDLTQQFLYNDVEATTKLARHMKEERVERAQYMERAVGTGAFTGLTVPQYLTEMYAPATAALRPFADICNKHPLPESGMSVEISRITTASSVDLQATQNTAVAEQNMDDTLLTVSVQTAAGQQTISRQAIDRGTGIEDVVFQDLFNRYATKLDSTLITQATNGLSAVAQANTYTDTTPTGEELYPKILGAASGVETNLLALGVPSHAVMHSRRWYWLSSQLSTKWPMINQPQLDPRVIGENFAVGYSKGLRGVLPNGLMVVVDNNIATNLGAGTNEDEIYVVPDSECHLWEDPQAPVFIRAEQPKADSLGVLIVVYGYFAYTFGRFTNGMQKVSGTGLVTPTF